MTISTQESKVNYSGDGTTTVFQIPFPFLEDTQIYIQKKLHDGSIQDLVLGTDYTVTGEGQENGGSATLLVSPPQGTTISIYRDVPLTQEVDYRENETFPAETHEAALDKLTMEVQQIQEQLDRSVKLDRFSNIDPEDIIVQIERVYDSSDNIDIVANNIADVNTVADSIEDVKNVGEISADLGDVIAIKDDISTVADIAPDVTTVANINEDVSNVASINTDVSNVASIKGDVTRVSDLKPYVESVASISSQVIAVGNNIDDVDIVSSNMRNILKVEANEANINTVAASNTQITKVSSSIDKVNTVADNITKVTTVADSIEDVTNVSTNILMVKDVSANMPSVKAAVTSAKNAKDSEDKAKTYADLAEDFYNKSETLGDYVQIIPTPSASSPVTTITFTKKCSEPQFLQIYVDRVKLLPSEYTLAEDGMSVTLSKTVDSEVPMEVDYFVGMSNSVAEDLQNQINSITAGALADAVTTNTDQTITGSKTFTGNLIANTLDTTDSSANVATTQWVHNLVSESVPTNMVTLDTAQTITGTKTFTASPLVPTPTSDSDTTSVVNVDYINTKFVVAGSLPTTIDANTFYFIY